MHKHFLKTSTALAAAWLLLGAGSASAQTPVNGPYYAVPSWDQTLPAATRFVVLANFASQAVLDRETGLVWERAPSTQHFLNAPPPGVFGGTYAEEHCEFSSVGGRKGWRVPSIVELASLMDPTQTQPALPVGHPFTINYFDPFWSATPYYKVADTYRIAYFQMGVTGATSANASLPVWCVRGGAGEAQY
jgi:hypothetical protein